MISWLLKTLQWILCCGETDEAVRFRDTTNHGHYYAAPAWETTPAQRLPAARPSLRAPQAPPPSSSSPLHCSYASVVQSGKPSTPVPSTCPSIARSEPPRSPLPSSKPTPRIPTPSSSRASPSLTPSTKVSSTPHPSACPSIARSEAPPSPLPSSKATLLIPTPLSSRVSPSLHPLTKVSSTPLPSSNVAARACPSLARPNPPSSPLPSLKASPSNATPSIPSPSLKASPSKATPSINGDKSPVLLEIKKKGILPRYEIPKHLKDLIEKDKVPPVLISPLSPSTYADYFASLLYAEDYYVEKWSDFIMSEVTLELHSRAKFKNAPDINKTNKIVETNKKDFVAFDIRSVPGRRPFLLSRDFVFVRPSGKITEPFKGILFRVVKSTLVVVDFQDDFHKQHSPTKKYDVSFSFNRVCLKRSHQAVSAAKDLSLHHILFPDARSSQEGPLPHLIEGPISTTLSDQLSSTGSTVQNLTLKIYKTTPHCRILVCAPRNLTCDALMRSFQKKIPRSELFRANAAFREYDIVPDDIIPACLYEGECFTCPPLKELQEFKVIMSTFMSSFRLRSAGIAAGHFTHIFLVDASSATEPEAAVVLASLVGPKSVVVVTGSATNHPWSVRSDIGRRHGLRMSYFHRLLEREAYSSHGSKFITRLVSGTT